MLQVDGGDDSRHAIVFGLDTQQDRAAVGRDVTGA